MLNVAVFGQTAKEWRDENHEAVGNIRDNASINQLLVLANMESYNAILIEQGRSQSERLVLIRDLAMKQFKTLSSIKEPTILKLKEK